MSAVLQFVHAKRWELLGIVLPLILIVLYFVYDLAWSLMLFFVVVGICGFVQLTRQYFRELRNRHARR